MWITTNWKILKEMGLPDHLTCLLRNLYVDQAATVRTGHETCDWFKIGKGVWQGCILSLCLFNFYAEYIIWNAGVNESQAGTIHSFHMIGGRSINNLRYADNTTLMAEIKEELKSLFMRVKEESEKLTWNSTFKKNKDHDICSHHLMTNKRGKSRNNGKFNFFRFQNHCGQWLQPWN